MPLQGIPQLGKKFKNNQDPRYAFESILLKDTVSGAYYTVTSSGGSLTNTLLIS